MHLPTWIVGPIMNLYNRLFPKRPELRIEIRQVCLDRVLASLTPDWSDYTFDLYFFLYVWIVNQQDVTTTVKEWKLTVEGDKGQTAQADQVPDISQWHQHFRVREVRHGLPMIADTYSSLAGFPTQALQRGIAAEGWVCFIAHGVRESLLNNASIELIVVDSFDRRHAAKSKGPWPCKGDVVNTEMAWHSTEEPDGKVGAEVSSENPTAQTHPAAARHWWDRVKPYVEIVGIVCLIVYTVYTIKMYHANQTAALAAKSAAETASGNLTEVQKQTLLMRQQIIGTSGAVVNFAPNIAGDKLYPVLENHGHVVSPNAHIKFQMSTAPLFDLNKMTLVGSYSETIPQLTVGGWNHPYDIGLNPGRDFINQKYTVKIEGTYDFDNGFGDRFTDKFCYLYLAHYLAKTDDGGTENGGPGFWPCDQFQEKLHFVRTRYVKP